jgi:integrase
MNMTDFSNSKPAPPSIGQAVGQFFDDFDFGDEGVNTRAAYASGSKAFLSFIDDHYVLSQSVSIEQLPDDIIPQFKAWLTTAEHGGRGRPSDDDEAPLTIKGYSQSTQRLYLQALRRLLRYWWFKEWLSFTEAQSQGAESALSIRSKRTQSVITRADQVPVDFGYRMMETADEIPLPTLDDIPDERNLRKERLIILRLRALVHLLSTTGLRISDLLNLQRDQWELLRQNGVLTLQMSKTRKNAYIFYSSSAGDAVYASLNERNDNSPFLFIQHGRYGAPPKRGDIYRIYLNKTLGYGAQLGANSAWKMIRSLAIQAGYAPEEGFIGLHAFRHWFAQMLIDRGATTDQVQDVLGHARIDTTKGVYVTRPNLQILAEIVGSHP